MTTFLACLLFKFLFLAQLTASEIESYNDLRITQLLPTLLIPFAVEPDIPKNFIVMSPKGDLSLNDWVYWGPKEVLEDYFRDPATLKEPILRVKLNAYVCQTGPNSFSGDMDAQMKALRDRYPEDFTFTKHKWESYPVLSLKAKMENQFVYMAWVGLNDPTAGWTLLFHQVLPNKEKRSQQDEQLWTHFIEGTKQLQKGDFFKACGQDLQDGYTHVNMGGLRVKVIAEKRKKDGKLQAVIIPMTPDILFEYKGMSEGLMGGSWRHGEPLVKIFGRFIKNEGNCSNIIDYTTSVFIKEVDQFSHNLLQSNPKMLVFQK